MRNLLLVVAWLGLAAVLTLLGSGAPGVGQSNGVDGWLTDGMLGEHEQVTVGSVESETGSDNGMSDRGSPRPDGPAEEGPGEDDAPNDQPDERLAIETEESLPWALAPSRVLLEWPDWAPSLAELQRRTKPPRAA